MSRQRDKERYQEYLRYSDANDCSFRDWLKFRNQDWYLDMKAGIVRKYWWEE